MSPAKILLLLSVIAFVLAFVGIDTGKFNLIALGLALFAAAGLV